MLSYASPNVTVVVDPRRAEARRLRVTERLSVAELCQRLGVGRVQLTGWLDGIPLPPWTRRPNAKDDLRERAVRLRADGWPVQRIAAELGVAKSTAYQWVRHLPLGGDPEQAERRRAHAKLMTDARWDNHRRDRDGRQAAAHADAVAAVGRLSDRDVLLLGAAIYWCEGTKSKPWRREDRLTFINSDVGLLAIFIRFLEVHGIDRTVPSYRVTIHETADAEAAGRWWAEQLGLPSDRFRRPTLKRHVPRTIRRNAGDDYHGCLVVAVPRSRELYWKVEGVMLALAAKQ